MKPGLNRREFLIRAGSAGGAALAAPLVGCRQGGQPADGANSTASPSAAIVCDPNDPVTAAPAARWAVDQLASALTERGIQCLVHPRVNEATHADICIIAGGPAMPRQIIHTPEAPESLSLAVVDNGKQITVCAAGRDARGLVYAVTELADVVRCSREPLEALRTVKTVSERPKNKLRGVMRLFVSDVEDKGWFNDQSFWQRYLTMLVTQRFNRFNLALGLGYDLSRQLRDTYFFFAYPFLVSVPGHDVRAIGLSDDERDQNLRMLRYISDQAALRGLHFQLGLWTHSFQWIDSPDANYVIGGLTPDRHAVYCRDALQKVLQECPSIGGVTFRIHGESGVAEGSYDFWKTVFDGIVRAGRPIEIDMHAKGMDQRMIDVALATGMPVNISPKFWAEHMGLPYFPASIRQSEMPANRPTTGLFTLSSGSRSFLRYGFGDLLKAGRKHGVLHRIWPGTQRLLLWGDPKFAAEYGGIFDFLGSDGVEIFDPLSFKGREGSGLAGGRDGYADASLKPGGGDWEKYLLTYRLWGRMTYNPDTDPEVWQRQLRLDLGEAAGPMESALAQASRILPLITTAHDPSAANASYWPEMYSNQSIVDPLRPGPYGETPRPRVFGNVSPLDPQLFAGINEYCDALVKGETIAKVSPLEVAQQLDDWARGASFAMAGTGDPDSPTAARMILDCEIAAGLGRFFADKFRAAILFGVFDRLGDEPAREMALAAYQHARDVWAGLATFAKGFYMSDVTFGPMAQLRGHWLDRLPAIEQDIAAMQKYQRTTAPADGAAQVTGRIIAMLNTRIDRPGLEIEHAPPAPFRKGDPIAVRLIAPASVSSTRLWFRHVDQAERFSSTPMRADGSSFTAEIPAAYTDGPFAIQYYFELRDTAGEAHLHPGFGPDFCGQPYYITSSG